MFVIAIEVSLRAMWKSAYILLIGILLVFGTTSCDRGYSKVTKSTDMDYKLEKAMEYYANGDCFRAIPLFEEMMTYFKGSRDLEDIYYGYCDCHYMQKEYIVAAYHFERYTQLYPKSPKVEDAAFMIAKCNHQQSPKYNLDQTPTIDAIAGYQRFTERYPNSSRVDDANAAIDELREKLMLKAFDNAMLYYRLKDYQAAATSFKNLILDFPASQDAERAFFYVVMSNKLFADNSYADKRLERYEETLKEYDAFIKKYPDSGYLKDLENIRTSVERSMEKLTENTTNIN